MPEPLNDDPRPPALVDQLCDALEAHIGYLLHDTPADLESLCDAAPEVARRVIAALDLGEPHSVRLAYLRHASEEPDDPGPPPDEVTAAAMRIVGHPEHGWSYDPPLVPETVLLMAELALGEEGR